MPEAQPGQEQRMEPKLAICKTCAQMFDMRAPHDCPGLTTRPTADLGEDGDLARLVRKWDETSEFDTTELYLLTEAIVGAVRAVLRSGG